MQLNGLKKYFPLVADLMCTVRSSTSLSKRIIEQSKITDAVDNVEEKPELQIS